MKISVVIPAYNEELLLPYCLSSLKKQQLPKDKYEIIVVDNNSTDQTAQIARRYKARVVYEARRGIVYARAKGVAEASGDIIVGIDADCVVPNNFLKTIEKNFENKDIVGLCGTVYFNDAPLIVKFFARVLTFYAHLFSTKFGRTPLCWALNFSFRKDAFVKSGGYDTSLPMIKAGLNTQGSDEYNLVKKLIEKNKKKVIFTKNLYLTTSGRRFNRRFLYWLFVEHIFGFIINEKLYNTFGLFIPMRSYYDRIVPSRTYAYVFQSLILSALFFFLSPVVSSKIQTIDIPSYEISAEIEKGAKEKIQQVLKTITPYIKQENS